ncbi:MAG TPA: toll/interleukin-1 receptor domain-containing protein [Opitutaceae bacterium]|jgi:hypothetical protein
MANSGDTPRPAAAPPSVFISYASQDLDAVRLIRDALVGAGFDVWHDENELGGGDAWDQKIRRQIRECVYFMPVISANANARHEGYFRREWRLAVERTLDMADDVTFIVPIAIDPVNQASARVPDKFLAVQWLSLPGGRPTTAFSAWCARLLSGAAPAAPAPRLPPAGRPAPPAPPPVLQARAHAYPRFPEEKPGQRLHFLFSVAGWALQYAWAAYWNMPRRWRRLLSIVIFLALLDQTCSENRPHRPSDEEKAKIEKAAAEVSEDLHGTADSGHDASGLAKLGGAIAEAVNHGLEEDEPQVLVVPFQLAGADAASAGFCQSVFASLYGKLSVEPALRVGLVKDGDAGVGDDPLKLGRLREAKTVLYGSYKAGPSPVLEVAQSDVGGRSVMWTRDFPAAGDPLAVAEQIRALVRAKP